MAIPFLYSYRSIWTRKLTTVLTASGMALVVFVFASISMLAAGLEKTLVETGSYENVIVIRKGSRSEIDSSIDRNQASIVETLPEIAVGKDGGRLLEKEAVVLVSMPKRDSDKPSMVTVRGTFAAGSIEIRPQVRLSKGRLPRPGTYEIISGESIARRFKNAGLGEVLHFATRDWTVVGVFDAGSTGFNSEVWCDVDTLMQAFRRTIYSTVILKLRNPDDFERVKDKIGHDPRLNLDAKRETKFYAEQSEMMAKFLRVMGTSLSIIFSFGAVIGAMITMYSTVANRINEIGTLRALGFGRMNILASFLVESLLIGLVGGAAGLFLASFLQFFTVSTLNFQTFSELAFTFTLTFGIALKSLMASLTMGLVGGLLPAIRASRMSIVDALRTG
jgi:putative ABC transport system permease protein